VAYDINMHRNRVALRSDLTVLLTHLTRARPKTKPDDLLGGTVTVPGEIEASALDVLMEILETLTIKGSGKGGYVIGSQRAGCFQDTPLYCLGQMFYQEKLVKEKDLSDLSDAAQRTDFRYTLHGLAFEKKYVWDKGGRPVFYEDSDKAKQILPQDQWWRIVDMNYTDLTDLTDWTHEREWRVPGYGFNFTLRNAWVILPGPRAYRSFLDHPKQKEHNFADKVRAIVPVSPILF
jgi:hypothetical protein